MYFSVYFHDNRELGENMTDEELRAMIDEFDRDGDGESMYLYTVETRNFEVAWFDIPVASMSF